MPFPTTTEPVIASRIFMPITSTDVLHGLVAVLLPPLRVFMQEGFGPSFWLNVLLTVLGYVPGLLHALWRTAHR